MCEGRYEEIRYGYKLKDTKTLGEQNSSRKYAEQQGSHS